MSLYRCVNDLHDHLKRASLSRHLLEVYRTSLDDKLHDVPIWEHWLTQSEELSPDYDRLPSIAGLPDVLHLSDGARVCGPEEWPKRRAESLELLRYYQLGSWPPPLGGLQAINTSNVGEPGLHTHAARALPRPKRQVQA